MYMFYEDICSFGLKKINILRFKISKYEKSYKWI